MRTLQIYSFGTPCTHLKKYWLICQVDLLLSTESFWQVGSVPAIFDFLFSSFLDLFSCVSSSLLNFVVVVVVNKLFCFLLLCITRNCQLNFACFVQCVINMSKRITERKLCWLLVVFVKTMSINRAAIWLQRNSGAMILLSHFKRNETCRFYCLRENCTPNQKLACFVLYLKIINTSLKNNICIL